MQRLLESVPSMSSRTLTGGAAAVTAGLAGAYYLGTRPTPFQPPCSLEQQSVEVEGESGARMSCLLTEGNVVTTYDGVTTYYEAFQRGRRVANGTGRCLGWRSAVPNGPYQWITYDEVYERTVQFGSGLLEMGLPPGQDTFVGIFSQNRPEWLITDLACQAFSMVAVPLYDTLGPQAISFILSQANLHTIVCDTDGKVATLLDSGEGRSVLKRIIVMDDISDSLKQKAISLGIEVVTFSTVEDIGKSKPHDPVPPKPEDLFTICYTSGTTGVPKGVMLTHKNLITTLTAFEKQLESIDPFLSPDDVHVSYLPLPHMYERTAAVGFFNNGAQIGFYGGNIKTLMDDIKELRPTIFPCVPRLLNRIYDKVIAGVQGSYVKRTLFEIALKRKAAEVKRGICRRDSIWDKLVFSKVQDLLGGRVRGVMTGAAPLSETVITFLRAALGCHVIEGYASTESTAALTVTLPGDNSVGHVGCPLICNLVKLVDIPEMDYYTKNNQGEVCAKGPNVMKGYYKSPEKTAEAIDEDGWLHTGDVGEWLPNGALKIIDRKKNLFKLAQGEYVAPEKVENIYTSCPVVAQAFVHGDSVKSSCVGIIVPDPEVLPGWAMSKLNLGGTFEELCKSTLVKDAIMQEITALGKKNGLYSFEQVKSISLQTETFSLENGLLTPTFKSKRDALRTTFQSQIQEMYSKLS